MSILTSRFVRREISSMHSLLSDLPFTGESVSITEQGEVKHHGLFGQLLENIDDQRHADLLEAFSRTPRRRRHGALPDAL